MMLLPMLRFCGDDICSFSCRYIPKIIDEVIEEIVPNTRKIIPNDSFANKITKSNEDLLYFKNQNPFEDQDKTFAKIQKEPIGSSFNKNLLNQETIDNSYIQQINKKNVGLDFADQNLFDDQYKTHTKIKFFFEIDDQNNNMTRIKFDSQIEPELNELIQKMVHSAKNSNANNVSQKKIDVTFPKTNEIILYNDINNSIAKSIVDMNQTLLLSTNSTSILLTQSGNDAFVLLRKNNKLEYLKIEPKMVQSLWEFIVEKIIYPLLKIETKYDALTFISKNPKYFGEIINKNNIICNNKPILFAYRGILPIDMNIVFPNNPVFYAGSKNQKRLTKNLVKAIEMKNIIPEQTRIFSGIPKDLFEYNCLKDQLGKNSWEEWAEVKNTFNTNFDELNELKYNRGMNSIQNIQDSFANDKFVVLIGHCDGKRIFFANNNDKYELTVNDILKVKKKISKNKPFVLLLNCNTGGRLRSIGELDSKVQSFTEALLDAGASGVVAPLGEIDAIQTIEFMSLLLKYSAEYKINFNDLLRDTLKSINHECGIKLIIDQWVIIYENECACYA